MTSRSVDELRQIKWILAGMLVCLFAIATAAQPQFLPMLITAIAAIVIVKLVSLFNATIRDTAAELWRGVRGMWWR